MYIGLPAGNCAVEIRSSLCSGRAVTMLVVSMEGTIQKLFPYNMIIPLLGFCLKKVT